MTTVGLASMKRDSGPEATSITTTATTTAMTMMPISSVMPTAVMIESTEKTRSSRRIWTITAPMVAVAALETIVSL